MSFTRFRQSLCFNFFLQSPFFTFVGSKVGVAVGALASHLQIQPGRQVFTHDVWSSHYDAKFDLPFFLVHMLDTYSLMYPFSNLHAICIVWPVSLFPFT